MAKLLDGHLAGDALQVPSENGDVACVVAQVVPLPEAIRAWATAEIEGRKERPMNARVRFDFREARRRRPAWVRRALAAACAVGASGAAAADLEWFDRHGAGHRPIALAEIVACADAVHAFIIVRANEDWDGD